MFIQFFLMLECLVAADHTSKVDNHTVLGIVSFCPSSVRFVGSRILWHENNSAELPRPGLEAL